MKETQTLKSAIYQDEMGFEYILTKPRVAFGELIYFTINAHPYPIDDKHKLALVGAEIRKKFKVRGYDIFREVKWTTKTQTTHLNY